MSVVAKKQQQKRPSTDHDGQSRAISIEFFGRGERIRTSDPSVPNRVLYQAEPRPDVPGIIPQPVGWRRAMQNSRPGAPEQGSTS